MTPLIGKLGGCAAKLWQCYFPRERPLVFNDVPNENAFCRTAPSLRFSLRLIVPADVFWRAIVFSSRTSAWVHSRRVAFFFAAMFFSSIVLELTHR
jgi:hypothetical protein